MGIRNERARHDDMRHRAGLTTPHGDQERVALPDEARGIGISLPLMGIRNPPRSMCRRAHRALTTPHGDQERTSKRGLRGNHETHYPSWGSGTRRAPIIAVRHLADSLPLMGIRNSRPGVRRSRPRRLTTPHGDQERARRRRMVRAAPASHYPSWGSGTTDFGGHGRTPHSSLPLMGIRNARAALRSVPGASSHYPSWGSARPGPSAHYPSWGSGTTTPIRTFRSRGSSSLPLMGIRNCSATAAFWSPNSTHYPSWGSGTPTSGLTIHASRRSHYPSWGSGTRRKRLCHRKVLWLTTPHGDQERPAVPVRAQRPRLLTTPHGDQEPLGGAEDRVHGPNSLPLMGIRNRRFKASVMVASPTSLPLMGIRNERLEAEPRALLRLTTPHGDQERAPASTSATRAQSHYPSWGSGTPAARAGAARRRAHYPSWGSGTGPSPDSIVVPTSSLPLMGIRNRQGNQRHRHAHLLTTPHGDQELPAAALPSHNPSLTTPHGDQELGEAGEGSKEYADSLPLMGIRNATVTTRPSATS